MVLIYIYLSRVELLEELPKLDAVFICVGGGGLISGIGLYLKSVKPSIQVAMNRTACISFFLSSNILIFVLFHKLSTC